MKHIILTLTFLMTVITTNAQSIFATIHTPADELLDMPAITVYSTKDIALYITETTDTIARYSINLKAPQLDVFDADENQSVTIGLYNENDSLINKFDWDASPNKNLKRLSLSFKSRWLQHVDLHMYPSRLPCDCADTSIPLSRLIDFILNKKGYIRIFANTYSSHIDTKAFTLASRPAIIIK